MVLMRGKNPINPNYVNYIIECKTMEKYRTIYLMLTLYRNKIFNVYIYFYILLTLALCWLSQ